MKPSGAAIVAIIIVTMILVALIVRSDNSAQDQPTRAPELPPITAQQASWLTPALGPEPNAYDPNRWWQPSNNNRPCDPNDPYCPSR
jgi:hypothetical protein